MSPDRNAELLKIFGIGVKLVSDPETIKEVKTEAAKLARDARNSLLEAEYPDGAIINYGKLTARKAKGIY